MMAIERSLLWPRRDIFMLNKRISYPGYAVTEILLAVVIISIAFIEISRAYANISGTATSAISMSLSSNLANSIMERVMAQDFDAKGNEKGGYALSFDGENDYVDCGNAPLGGSFSVECWVKPSQIATNWAGFVCKNEDKSSGEGVFWLGQHSTDGFVRFGIYLNGTNENILDTDAAVIANGSWFHVAATYDGNYQKIYINGSLVKTSSNLNSVLPSGTSNYFMGRSTAATGYYSGKIDEIRIWDDVRTAQEIMDNYKQHISDPYTDSNLKLYLRLDSGTGAIAFDNSSNMYHGTINGSSWTSSWSTTLGREGENTWSSYDDVDDFNGIAFKGSDYTGLDANSNNFSGLGGRITIKYVSLNTGTTPFSFDNSISPTNFKQVTVKVGIPGTSDSTQLDAIKSAKADQGYALTFSPYGN